MGVISQAPARIDLAGGTLDIWPLYLLHPGSMTVNVAVSIYAQAEVSARPSGFAIESEDRGVAVEAADLATLAEREPRLRLAARLLAALKPTTPLALRLRAEAPAHAGLGGSSTLGIAVAAALDRATGGDRDREALLRLTQDVETAVIEVPTGQQDYLPALYGGVQALHWEVGGLRRERIPTKELAEKLVLVYTGAPRFSGANNWEVFKRRLDCDRDVARRLDGIRDAASALAEALRHGDDALAGEAIASEWEERRLLSPGITTPEIEALGAAAIQAGARAFKACGAGGGGCVVAFVDPERRGQVEAAMTACGGDVLPVAVDETGLVVRET